MTELALDIRSGQNVVVISPRRFGKTSLVLATLDMVGKEGVLYAYADLLRASTYEQLPQLLATAIYRGVVAPLERVARRAADVFADLPIRPKITVDASTGAFTVEFVGAAPERDVARTIERLLELPGELARRRDRRYSAS
jgi:hypothetical protein